MDKKQNPQIFISYSHDSEAHKIWVRQLAEKLEEKDVPTILDQWDLRLGGDLPYFMEQGLANATRILVICTDTYVRKANAGEGGTGYERMILTSHFMKSIASHRIIPIVRQSTTQNKVPDFIASRFYIDFRDDQHFTANFDVLLGDILGQQRYQRPQPGSDKYKKTKRQQIGAQVYIHPGWASDSGLDQYGNWADLNLNGVIQRMRWIESGSFLMGSHESEKNIYDDEGQHHVTLTKPFWLADTACSQALWQAVMSSNPSIFTDSDQNPVESISWGDCQEFCQKANLLIKGLDLRLPTEAEWEYACRAGTTGPFSFGENIKYHQANYRGMGTVPISEFEPNAWGLYQMHGNVWEWCQDWYGRYPIYSVTDPQGLYAGEDRVFRGGSWNGGAHRCRAACRYRSRPGNSLSSLGLRLAGVQITVLGDGLTWDISDGGV